MLEFWYMLIKIWNKNKVVCYSRQLIETSLFIVQNLKSYFVFYKNIK